MKSRIHRLGCLGLIVALFAFLAYWISVIYSERTLLTVREANNVVITIHTQSYRFPDDASVLWSVSRDGQSVVDGLYIDGYTNPIWPKYKALRSKEGTVIGIINADNPKRVLALYDVASGEHWDTSFDEGNNPGVGKALLSKLQTGVDWPLENTP
jgi:hypothetical protein